jgi:ABC-type multidrug transport system fused ATPase/permease subunit
LSVFPLLRVGSIALTAFRNFSGSQCQRICFARALLLEPKVVIFDEATSSLDVNTEAKVQRSVKTQFPK